MAIDSLKGREKKERKKKKSRKLGKSWIEKEAMEESKLWMKKKMLLRK